jgi:hypothetical protein
MTALAKFQGVSQKKAPKRGAGDKRGTPKELELVPYDSEPFKIWKR